MENSECSICEEAFESGAPKGSYFCSNNHLYHSKCAWPWLKVKLEGYNPTVDNKGWTCPLCRQIPTSRRMLDVLIQENIKEEDRKVYQDKLKQAYPHGFLERLFNDINLEDVVQEIAKLLLALLTGTLVVSYLTLSAAFKVSEVAHRCLSQALDMEEQRLFIIEMNLALLALIILSV